MMNERTKKILIHAGIVLAMFAVACIYMAPALQGKGMVQGDTVKWQAMANEQLNYHEKTGSHVIWNSSMFSGMPGYQITTGVQSHSVYNRAKAILNLDFMGLSRDVGVVFLYLLGFYVCLIAFGVNPWLSLLGALAFGLGSYNIIIIEAGHITKAWAMSMMAPVLGGMVLTFRRKYLWGGILFAIALGLQVAYNHIQITYYTMLTGVIIGIVYGIYAIKEKTLKQFLIGVAVLIPGCIFAIGCNSSALFSNQEYVKYTMRGGNEITVTPEDLYHDGTSAANVKNDGGLDIDYAFGWSYGIGETYTLLVPGAYGGGSGEKVGTESSFYKTFRSQQAPLYWGDQPFTSGPVYFGAIVVFLFILGLLVVKGPERWWLLLATILAVLLAWGRNFMPFNEFIFKHLPMYSMFRTPSMSLVIANVAMVIMGVLALKTIFDNKDKADTRRMNRALYIATGAVGLLILLVLVLSSSFSFSGSSDQQMAAQYGAQWDMIKSVLVSDRAALLRSDSWRSLIFILLAAATLWLYINQKIKKSGIAVAVIAALVVADLWAVDRRYLDETAFVEKNKLKLRPSQTDMELDQLAMQYGDQDYRVFDLSVNTFNDSHPSAFHHQVGGYHAAKLRRYQDIIDFYLTRHINMRVLNMLNARYIVMQNHQIQRNPDALGNCWFVQEVKPVGSANDEIMAINAIDPAVTAVVDTTKFSILNSQFSLDSTATIVMEHQKPYNTDYVKYRSHSATEQLAVFSEIYYAPDWRAYIDGKPAEYLRANYVLRAMVIPAGDHVIEFKCEAPRLYKLVTVNIVCSILVVLMIAGAVVLTVRNGRKEKGVAGVK